MAAGTEAGTGQDGRRWEVKAVRGDTALRRPGWEAVGLRCTRLTAETTRSSTRSRMHDGTTFKTTVLCTPPSLSFFCFRFVSTNMSLQCTVRATKRLCCTVRIRSLRVDYVILPGSAFFSEVLECPSIGSNMVIQARGMVSSTDCANAGGQEVKVASPWRTSPRPSLVVVLVVLCPALESLRVVGFATASCCVACWTGRPAVRVAAVAGKGATEDGKEVGATSSSSWAKSCHEIRPHESRFKLRPFSAAGKGRVWCSNCGGCRRRSGCFDSTYSSASSTLSKRIWRPSPCCSSLVHPSDTEEAAVEALAMLHRCESRREEAAEEVEEEEKEVAVERVE